MPITVIGHLGSGDASNHDDRHTVETIARVHEASGFDRLLLPFEVSDGQGRIVLQQAEAVTEKLGFLMEGPADLASPSGAPDERLAVYDHAKTGEDMETHAAGPGITDLFALPAGSVQQVARIVRTVRRAAERHGRHPAFLLSVRPILGATRDAAWRRARAIEERLGTSRPAPHATPSRLFNIVRIDRQARHAWPSPAGGGAISPVGTPEQVVRSLLDYYDLGIEHIALHGFAPLDDAIDYGRDLIPLLRRRVAYRDGLLAVLAG